VKFRINGEYVPTTRENQFIMWLDDFTDFTDSAGSCVLVESPDGRGGFESSVFKSDEGRRYVKEALVAYKKHLEAN